MTPSPPPRAPLPDNAAGQGALTPTPAEQTADDGSSRPAVWSAPNLTRVGGVIAVAAGLAAALADVDDVPGYAMGLEWVFRAERALLVFAVATGLLTFVVHVVIRGRVPTEISTTGGKWAVAEGLGDARAAVEDLRHALYKPGGLVDQHDELWIAHTAGTTDTLLPEVESPHGDEDAQSS